jgi:hypothetical protein
MKKAIFGLLAVGAIVGLRPAARRIGHKMREHCQQMAAKCKQMMAGQSAEGGEAAGMPGHCKQMAAQFRGDDEATGTREQPEREAPQFGVASGEPVGTA